MLLEAKRQGCQLTASTSCPATVDDSLERHVGSAPHLNGLGKRHRFPGVPTQQPGLIGGGARAHRLQQLPAALLLRLQRTLQHFARPRSHAVLAALNLGPTPKLGSKADQSSDLRHQADLKQLFNQIDADGNGKLDPSELQVTSSSFRLKPEAQQTGMTCICPRPLHSTLKCCYEFVAQSELATVRLSVGKFAPLRLSLGLTSTLRILQGALSQLGLPCSRDYLSDMLTQYDENHDGLVDYTEFQHYVKRRRFAMERAFDKLDTDKSGSISEPELASAVCPLLHFAADAAMPCIALT